MLTPDRVVDCTGVPVFLVTYPEPHAVNVGDPTAEFKPMSAADTDNITGANTNGPIVPFVLIAMGIALVFPVRELCPRNLYSEMSVNIFCGYVNKYGADAPPVKSPAS